MSEIVSEYDQEIPQSQTADNPVAQRGRVAQPSRDTRKTSTVRLSPCWLSGRVLDSGPRGRGFEPHQRHCVVVIEQDTFILA